MSRFRQQFTAAKQDYQNHRYQGSLAADIGLNRRQSAQPSSYRFQWRALVALAAMVSVVVLLWHNYETVQTPIAPTPKIAIKPASPQQPIAVATASAAASSNNTTATATAVSSTPSLSFESVTDWPSVSADVPSLGGFPALGWNTTQESQAPTTQGSSS